ncbi:MAG: hypothetical protein ACRDL6_04120 [Solirubrobacterales bacterium]
MRVKLTASLTACAALALAAIAHAGPIPVAQYTFATKADVGAFQTGSSGKCKRKWRRTAAKPKDKKGGGGMGGAMAVTVSSGSGCVLHTSVVADSSDIAPDQIVNATVSAGRGGSAKLQKRAFEGVVVRQNESSGYELRVLPMARKWQVLRDPKGSGPAVLMASGSGKFIRGGTKPNSIALRAFDFGGTQTSLIAVVNGKNVVSTTDSAMDQPDGRRNGVTVGVKGSGAGTGVVGVFDQVSIQVPNPF